MRANKLIALCSSALKCSSSSSSLHIAASNPKYVRREDIPEDVLEEQKDPEVFIKEKCLLEQPFVKDPSKTIQDYVNELIASIGENIFINRFTRYKVNEVE